MVLLERLRLVSSDRGVRHWTSVSAGEAAEIARRDIVREWLCLPAVLFCNQPVVPVIAWKLAALAERTGADTEPLLDRGRIAAGLSGSADPLPPPALSMLAFITVTPEQ